jgi:hypothetical protein
MFNLTKDYQVQPFVTFFLSQKKYAPLVLPAHTLHAPIFRCIFISKYKTAKRLYLVYLSPYN